MRFKSSMLDRDRGAILVLVMLFITVMSVLVTSVIARTSAGVRSVAVEREFLAKRYAAEGGIDYAVQALRSRTNLCPSSNTVNSDRLNPAQFLTSAGNAPAANASSPTVRVECTVTSNVDVGLGGYGLITRDNSTDGLTLSGAASETLRIDGPVFLADHDTPLRFDVHNGDVLLQKTGVCPIADSIGLSLQPTYRLQCVTDPAPAPVVTLPTDQLLSRSATPAQTWGGCSVFRPGKYTSINLNDDNYFASGVYYFEDVDLTIRRGSLTGGVPSVDESKTSSASCKRTGNVEVTDADIPGHTADGTGVKIILGGSSRMVADNPKGVIELFARQATAASAVGEGTQRVSVMTVSSNYVNPAGTSFKKSEQDYADANPTDLVLGVVNVSSNPNNGNGGGSGNGGGGGGNGNGGGSTIELVTHGAVYIPQGLVQVRNASAKTLFRGGMLVGRLDISTSANVSGFNIGIRTTPLPRDMRIVSTASGAGATERVLTATATVRIDATNDTVQVLSRSVG